MGLLINQTITVKGIPFPTASYINLREYVLDKNSDGNWTIAYTIRYYASQDYTSGNNFINAERRYLNVSPTTTDSSGNIVANTIDVYNLAYVDVISYLGLTDYTNTL